MYVCDVLQVRDVLVPLVQPWVPLLCSVLSADPAARPSWTLKLAALRLAQALTSYFSKPLAAAMPPLMGATWQLLLALQVSCCWLLLQAYMRCGVTLLWNSSFEGACCEAEITIIGGTFASCRPKPSSRLWHGARA